LVLRGQNNQCKNNAPNSEIIIYEGDSGQPSIEVRIEGETVWLTQAKLAELFKTSRPNITIHIKNILMKANYMRIQYVRTSYILPQTERNIIPNTTIWI
jgi:hypothetical protein